MTSYLVAIYNRTVDGHAQGSDNPIRVKVPTLMALQRELANLLRLANNPRGQYAGRIHSATKPCRVCCSSASYNVVRRFGTYQQDGIHMDGPSTEATELELLERVFLRLGVAESDSQLEQVLARFLAPVLLKTASTRPAVQSKVLELLTHVSKRLKSRPAVQLPVEQLLAQFTDHASPAALVNFSLVYLRQGYPRLPPAKQTRLLPPLLLSLPIRTAQQDSVLQLCVPALVHLEWSGDMEKRRELLPLSDQSDVSKILLQFLLLYLLLPYGSLEVKAGQLPPPGLNRTLITKVTGGTTPSPEELEERKMAIVKLLSSEVLASDHVICQLIVATGDPKSSVSELAEHHVKLLSHGVDWETPELIHQLLSLFLGTMATPGKRPSSQQPSPSPEAVSGCNIRIRIKILSFLLKSTLTANSFPACIQLVFDGLFGTLTNPKLRSLILQFIHHICRSAADQKVTVMAPILLTGLYKIIERPDEESKMKSMAYTGVGLLAQRSPTLFLKDPHHLLRLFSVFTVAEPVDRDLGLAIQECMGLVAPAYRGVGGQTALLLEAALLENIYNTTPRVRLMAALLAGSLFPFSHTPSRFVSMIACGDSKEDVREAGKKGLISPGTSDGGVNAQPPAFPAVVGYLHKRAAILLESGNCYVTAAGKLPFAPAIMTEALKFLLLCLECSAGVTSEHRLTNTALKPLTHYLSQLTTACIDEYLDLLLQSLGPAGDLELHSVAMEGLLQIVASLSSQLAPRLLPQLTWIRGFTRSSRTSVCEPAGQLVGMLCQLLGDSEFLTVASQIYQDTFSTSHYVQLGAVVTLGHVTSTAVNRLQQTNRDEPGVMETNQQGQLEEFVMKSLMRFMSLLSGPVGSAHLITPACTALGHVSQGGPLPLNDGDEKGEGEGEGLTKMELIKQLRKILDSKKDIRVREQCAIALGRMAVYERDSTHGHALLEALFSVREEKAVELQFTVGEALSCVAVGPLSTALVSPWTQGPGSGSQTPDHTLLTRAVDTILRDHAPHPLASVRQSACIWLLCVLKHASRHNNMQNHLHRLQSVFMNLLADTNEITQEVAARGLGLTYELCDGSTKQEMVQNLVGTLLEGRRIEQKVTEETELFQKGELGKAPEGKGLSTYKELCSIASDLNKPDLIYRFMYLANHNALWNSKKGAAFGFSSIAEKSREELAPHLPQLVPRLYRYKYDPNPRVQLAMSSIWTAVVPESKKAVDRYLTAILDDLSHNLNSHLWRSRQASCMALSDLLVGQLVGDVADRLPSLWVLCLRVRDDIKETVRKAADVACKALHKVTIRACESPSIGPKVVAEVLPLILDKGMQNQSSEVRAISLQMILKMSENAGSLLKPHISVLVPNLLESLSSLEIQELNTLSLRLSGETEVLEKLDNIRMKASKMSPMMETIQLCIPHVDAEVLAGLVPRLIEILKSGVGLGTKAAAAQLVVSLVRHSRNDLTPYAGKLLTALTTGLLDRSAGVRKSSAQAIGHLVRISRTASVKKFLDKMNKWYFEKNDVQTQGSIAQVFHTIAQHSPDMAQSVMADFIPLVFLAMHTTANEEDSSSKAAVKHWRETWEAMVPGAEETCVRLYLPQLVAVARNGLQSQSWPIKSQGAAALATATERMGSSLPNEQLAGILTTLLDGLQGRTWDGKEALLQALQKVCIQKKRASLVTPGTPSLPSPSTITSALLTQCHKKQNPTYQAVAIETLGGVASTLEVDVFAEFSDIAFAILLPPADGGGRESGEEEGERREAAGLRMVLREKTAEALAKTWPTSPETQAAHFSATLASLSTVLPLSTWRVQLAIVTALRSIFSQSCLEGVRDTDINIITTKTVPAICKCLSNVKYSVLRQMSLQALDKITARLIDWSAGDSLSDSVLSNLRDCLAAVTDRQSKALATTVLHRLNTLQ